MGVARQALALILSASVLAGCSLSISAPSATRKKSEAPACDTGKGLVALDALMAVGFGIGGLAALSEDQGTGAIALVGAALFTAAALHGSSNADKCRAAFDQYAKETLRPSDDDEVARRPRRRKQPVVEAPPDDPPVVAPPVREPDPALADRLPSKQTEPPKPVAPPKPPKPPGRTDDWSQFWREVQP